MECSQPDIVVDNVIASVGKRIVLAAPLALGKPPQILNSFYQRAKDDPSLDLTIVTALTLIKPRGKSLLESRLIEPMADRVFGNYPDLLYELERQQLPKNIRVVEFYFPAGKYLKDPYSQQNYISSNYTHVCRDLIAMGVNVLCQLVAESEDKMRISLSCNPDVAYDVMNHLDKNKPYPYAFIAQVNDNLPFMYGEADLEKSRFHYILKGEEFNFHLFCPPKLSVSMVDHLIGLQASTLVKDGGEIQIGIGSLGDSLVHSLLLRQRNSVDYKSALEQMEVLEKNHDLILKVGGLDPLAEGLFAASEMFVDAFMYLIKEGIIKRRVYDHVILQRLLNEGIISEKVNDKTLYWLLAQRAISPQLSEKDFNFLQHFGIFKEGIQFQNGMLIFEDGQRVSANLNEEAAHKIVVAKALGGELKNGAIVHAAFFLGTYEFYKWLKDLPENLCKQIHMKSVLRVNQLYGHEELDILHRKNARFFNTCMMMTLSGSAVSDGLADGKVVSGVGGQYNFVAMAHELPSGRSILQMRSTRMENGDLLSNIVFNYGHLTIPRHLRDIVITEYGMADLRSKTDREVIISLIQIADSRFQLGLIEQAQAVGKLPSDFELSSAYCENTPEKLMERFKKIEEHFPPFPFGTDLTEEEIIIGRTLKKLKKMSKGHLVWNLVLAILRPLNKNHLPLLKRMKLDNANTFNERLYANLLNYFF